MQNHEMEGEKTDREQKERTENHQWHRGKGRQAVQQETNNREETDGTQLPRIPRKDTQQGKGGGGKTTVKAQLSEKLGKGNISQTKVLWSKASVTLPKAVFFSRKVLSCFCFK